MLTATAKLTKLLKHSYSNIQTHIDLGRVIEHKKYQMMNQINFNKAAHSDEGNRKKLEKNEVIMMLG